MRLITFSTLYPNAAQPAHGLFVEARLRELRARFPVAADVVAPVPWFPLRADRFGIYARYARAPRVEERAGVRVFHPRYPLLPKVGMHLAPRGLAFGAGRTIAQLASRGGPRPVLDAHYFYPDGVAAATLAARFDLPLVITARGSDINLLPEFPAVRRRILAAAERADALVAVSQALALRMQALGMPADKIHVVPNGVDLSRFSMRDRDAARAELGLTGPLLLSVGNLLPLKGHDLTLRALTTLPEATLVIAGQGPERASLAALAAELGVTPRVHFVGSVKQSALVAYYNAADVLILASSREGMANVLLESLACATPVVATRVGGNPEVVADAAAGVVVDERTPAALSAAVRQLLSSPPPRAATRGYAETLSWERSVARLYQLLTDVAASRAKTN